MNRKLVPAVALAATALAVPTVVAAPKPDQQLSISATPTTVTFGGDLKLSGQLSGGSARDVSGQNVTLQRDMFPYEGDFDRVETVDTDPAGNYSLTLKPISNAKYRTTAKGGVQSAEVTVPVRVAVAITVADTTPKRGARVKFSGTVTPPHDGMRARVQRRTSSGWRTVTKVTLVDGGDIVSTYSKRVRIRHSGNYRVRFNPGDGDHAAGNSAKVKLSTH